MEPDEYDRMDQTEDRLWWYRGLHRTLLDVLASVELPGDAPILDAGCGTGGLLRRLSVDGPGRDRIGLERCEAAARRARDKSGASVAIGSVDAMPFADGGFAAILSVDVLYHRDVDPVRAVREAFRCLMPGGVLVVNVPAFQWLSSYHDRRVHGARRFDRAGLARLLADAGFARVDVRYWNSLLFPLMVAHRLRPASARARSDVSMPAPWLNALLAGVVDLERGLSRLGVRYPAGGSVVAAARK